MKNKVSFDFIISISTIASHFLSMECILYKEPIIGKNGGGGVGKRSKKAYFRRVD
jgi:hypothetical protein